MGGEFIDVLFAGVSTTAESPSVDVLKNTANYSLITTAGTVSSGAVILLEGSADNTNWITLGTDTIVGNGTTHLNSKSKVRWVRANMNDYTDGTYTSTLIVDSIL